jgi:hypothetical protein
MQIQVCQILYINSKNEQWNLIFIQAELTFNFSTVVSFIDLTYLIPPKI